MNIDLDAEWITVGNGATELIHSFARTFIRKKAIIFNPTFCEYELASKRMGADILFVPLKNLNSDHKSIIEESRVLMPFSYVIQITLLDYWFLLIQL